MTHIRALVLLLCASASYAATFTKIADLSTPAPAGNGNFSRLNAPTVNSGRVGFLGTSPLADATQIGLYLWSNGAISRIADYTTAVPNGSGPFRKPHRIRWHRRRSLGHLHF